MVVFKFTNGVSILKDQKYKDKQFRKVKYLWGRRIIIPYLMPKFLNNLFIYLVTYLFTYEHYYVGVT